MTYFFFGFFISFVVGLVFFTKKRQNFEFFCWYGADSPDSCLIYYFDSQGCGENKNLGITILPFRFWNHFHCYTCFFGRKNKRCCIGLGFMSIYFDYTPRYNISKLIKKLSKYPTPIIGIVHTQNPSFGDNGESIARVLYSISEDKFVICCGNFENEVRFKVPSSSLTSEDGTYWDFKYEVQNYSITFMKPIEI